MKRIWRRQSSFFSEHQCIRAKNARMRRYTETEKIEKYMGIEFTEGLNDFVDSVIESVSAYIERYCGDENTGCRAFEAPADEETRYFDGNDQKTLDIGDVLLVSKVASYGVELTEDQDFTSTH